MHYTLTRFQKTGDDLIDEVELKNLTENEVRQVFQLTPEEPPGDCLPVEAAHLDWLTSWGVHVDLDSFDYFVEANA